MMRFNAACRVPWVFAAKTTASGLLALLVAFTFNLDQPQWALLTVFIVSQPQRDGLVLAKSFYRIIGTVIGAVVALLFVALFAQERVLFLGALACWVGLCTFGSQYARNMAAYSFVLSGYTVAIVGIAGVLDPHDAFYIATARVTEISLGIMVTATVSHLVLPHLIGTSLRKTIAQARVDLAACAVALLNGADARALRAKLLGQAIAIENLSASAIFEDPDLRKRRGHLRRVNLALIYATGAMQPLCRQLGGLPQNADWAADAIEQAVAAVKVWAADPTHAASFAEQLRMATERLPSIQQICLSRCLREEEVLGRVALRGNLQKFLSALSAYAIAYRDFLAGESRPANRVSLARSNDVVSATWTGLRAALGVALVSWFWILTAWPSGSTAAILGSVATARLATMGHAVPIARAGALIFALSAIPAFIAVEVLLPLASGFAMFALVTAPVIFVCALLIAHERTMLIGYLSGLLFASAGLFQDRMAYDAVGFINTSIAAVFACVAALAMWAIVAPETPDAARHRYARAVRSALARITAPRLRIRPAGFQADMTEAFDQLRGRVPADQPSDLVAFNAGLALLGAGRELIRMRESVQLAPEIVAFRTRIPRFVASRAAAWLRTMRCMTRATIAGCIAELRDSSISPERAQLAARQMVAAINVQDGLDYGRPLILGT